MSRGEIADGYFRQLERLVRRAKKKGIELLQSLDDFFVSPQHLVDDSLRVYFSSFRHLLNKVSDVFVEVDGKIQTDTLSIKFSLHPV